MACSCDGGGVGRMEVGGGGRSGARRLDEGMLGSVFLGSDGEGLNCRCSHASVVNWSVWVHGV